MQAIRACLFFLGVFGVSAAAMSHAKGGTLADEGYIARRFQSSIGEVPRLGWFIEGDRFMAAEHHSSLVLYSPAGAPSTARLIMDVTPDQQIEMRRRYRIACDIDAETRLHAYEVASPGATGAALYTSKRLPGHIRDGLTAVPLSPVAIADANRLLRWSVPSRVQRHEAVAVRRGSFFYSFHRRYDVASGVLRQEALVLHNTTGRIIAHELTTLREGNLCDGCGLPELRDGSSFVYRVLNIFDLAGFPYPVLLLDTSTIEGRALSLQTFTKNGRVASFRLYEYVVHCVE